MVSELNEKYLEKNIPEHPVTTLRDIQYWYGVIVASKKGYEADYGIHLSNFGNAGEEDSVLFCDFIRDSGGLNYDGISFRTYEENDLEQHERIMYVKYNPPAAKEHSITQKSKKDPPVEKIVTTAEDVIDWIQEDKVQEYINNEVDDYSESILSDLMNISGDDDILEKIRKDIEEETSNNPTECLVTIRVKEDSEWKYPGDYNELVEAMKYRRLSKNSSKTNFEVVSKGRGKTHISNQEDNLVGTPEDPLNVFSTKQQSTFTNLLNDESSWTSNPISFNESLHISLSDEIIDNLYLNIFYNRIYFIPYITGKPTVRKSKLMYKIVNNMKEDYIKGMLMTDQVDVEQGELNYYSIMLESIELATDMTKTIPKLRRPYILKLAEDYTDCVQEFVGDNSIFLDIDIKDGDELKNSYESDDEYVFTVDYALGMNQTNNWNLPIYRKIIYGNWIKESFSSDSQNDEFSENDTRSVLYQNTLNQTEFSWNIIINEFLKQILDNESENLKDNNSVTDKRLILHQLSMLETLNKNNIINYPQNENEEKVNNLENKQSVMKDPAIELKDAIKSLPDDTNDTHRFAFSIGAIVGRLSEYQRSQRKMNKTIINDHPISRMNSERLKRAVSDFVDKSSVYNLFGYSDQVNVVKDIHPNLEDISHQDENDIKYFYALGVAFGESQYWNSGEDSED